MTSQEILTKAITKAIDGGWLLYKFADSIHELGSIIGDEDSIVINLRLKIRGRIVQDRWHVNTWWLIFNHDFAKALWDNPERNRYGGKVYHVVVEDAPGGGWKRSDIPEPTKLVDDLIPAWQYHLQQMVIADDPIKYLGEHI